MTNEEKGMRDRILRDHGINPTQPDSSQPPSKKKRRRRRRSLYDLKSRLTGLDRHHKKMDEKFGDRQRRWTILGHKDEDPKPKRSRRRPRKPKS